MFSKKDDKQSFLNNLFSAIDNNKQDRDNTEMTLVERIKLFFKNFRYQKTEYKIAMILRILAWTIFIGLALCGLVFKIIRLFKNI